MRLYAAPMEGITDQVWRQVHHALFTGVEKYFIPFVSPTQNLQFTSREWSAIAPENNQGFHAVPQILAKNPEHFLWAAEEFRRMGYSEVNLNIGCPSGTVTAKGKGSGLLRDLPALRTLLDEVYAHAALPVSVKTRIGYDSPDQWPAILEILKDYPIHELIIHTRTRQQFYAGETYPDAFALAMEVCTFPLVYNGDLFSPEDCIALQGRFPNTHGLMLGRGLVANPALAQSLTGGESVTIQALRDYHDALYAAYGRKYQRQVMMGRMREMMKHMACCFEDTHKVGKALRKAAGEEQYLAAAEQLFTGHALKEHPCYDHWEYHHR